MVLYAKSGLGKTSLINAGLNQKLRDRGFIPLKVRFNNPGLEPLQGVYTGIREMVKQNGLDYEAGEEETLWQYFKTASFWSEDDTLLKPVLVLDQFEEFFVLHSSESRKQFIRQLADIVNNNIPKELQEAIQAGKPFPYSDNPPNVKIIISLREDYLGRLEEMSREIPDILHRRFRLQPLNCEQARQAIIEPSQVQDEVICATPFQYSPGAVDMMLNFLCKRKERNGIKITDEVEPFQLQLLCRHIEDNVRERANKKSGDLIVRKEELGGEKGMQHVLQRFYDNQVERLGSVWKIKRARKLCEKGLISVTNRRLSLEEEEIKRKFKVPQDLLAELVNRRVLRSEPRVGSVYYELSHDSMVAPIRESQEKRNSRRDTVVIGGIIGICLLIALIFFIQNLSLTDIIKINSLDKEARELEAKGNNNGAIEKQKKIIAIDKNSSEPYRRWGQLSHSKGDFDAEIEVYKMAMKRSIKDAGIYYQWGQAFIAKRKPKEAVKIYEKAIKNDIKSPDIYRELAVLHIEGGEPGKAIDLYRQALEFNSGYVDIYKQIVETLKKNDQENLIEKVYDIASGANHNDVSCYLAVGHYYELKDFNKAIDNFKKAEKFASGAAKAEAYNGWGNGLYYLKRYNEAIQKYQKAVKIKPDYADAYNGLGNALKYRKRYKEAIDAYEEAIELDPENPYAYYGWGNVLYSKKRYKEAIKKYEKAIEIKPDFAYAHNELGVALRKKREYKRAVEECRKAVELDPGYADAYYNMGLALRRLKQYTRAIEAYNKAVEIKHNLPWVHMELGNVLYRKKRYDEAIKAYENAIKIKPKKYAYAYKSIEEAYKKMGRIDKAKAVSKKAAKILQDADTFCNIGNDHLQEGEYKEAIKAFRDAIKFDSKHVDAYFGLASAYIKLRRYNEAITEYRKVIEIQPDVAAAYNAYVKLIKSKYNVIREAYLEATRNNPLDIVPRVELAEFCLIAGGFNRAFDMANELLREVETGRRIDHEYRMAMIFVYISSSFFRGERPEAIAKTSQFIKDYEKLPGNYRRSWSYAAGKRFISQDRRLTPEQRQLLLLVIEILESPKPGGMKKLPKLREAIHAVVKSGDS